MKGRPEHIKCKMKAVWKGKIEEKQKKGRKRKSRHLTKQPPALAGGLFTSRAPGKPRLCDRSFVLGLRFSQEEEK